LAVVWILNGENIFDCMIKILLALAYPVVVWLSCMWLFFLRWSSIWLMGADGRGSRGQQGNGNSVA